MNLAERRELIRERLHALYPATKKRVILKSRGRVVEEPRDFSRRISHFNEHIVNGTMPLRDFVKWYKEPDKRGTVLKVKTTRGGAEKAALTTISEKLMPGKTNWAEVRRQTALARVSQTYRYQSGVCPKSPTDLANL